MALFWYPPQPYYGFNLATFHKEKDAFALNSVCNYSEAEVKYHSIGVLGTSTSQSTAWVIGRPKNLKVQGKSVLCVVCTCAHAFINIFGTTCLLDDAVFTFAETENKIQKDLANGGYKALPIFCPATADTPYPEIDPISKRIFSLSHDIAIFIVLEKDHCSRETEVANPFQVNYCISNAEAEKAYNLAGYPSISKESVASAVLPDMKKLHITFDDLAKAFKADKALVASPGNVLERNNDMIAITNPAAPRMSGSPLIIDNKVEGILVGSIPLDAHIYTVKTALVVKQNLKMGIDYIKEHNLPISLYEPSSAEFLSEMHRKSILAQCKILNEDAYIVYFQDNPDIWQRYNLALSASNNYFKAAVLLTKQLESFNENFTRLENLLNRLKEMNTWNLTITKHSILTHYLTAVLDQSFDQVFSDTVVLYETEQTESFSDTCNIKSTKDLQFTDRIFYYNFYPHSNEKILVKEAITGNRVTVAVKIYRGHLKNFQDEINILSSLSGERQCFLKYYGSIVENRISCIVTEICDRTLQKDMIQREKNNLPYRHKERMDIIKELLGGFTFMHKMQIYHQDIKPQNIMITAENIVKIIGFSRNIRYEDSIVDEAVTGEHSIQGSKHWLPPELVEDKSSIDSILDNNSPCDPSKSDIFALGLVFLQLFTFNKLCGLNREDQNDNLQLVIRNDVEPPWLGSLISQMLDKNPKERPLLKRINKSFIHSYLREF